MVSIDIKNNFNNGLFNVICVYILRCDSLYQQKSSLLLDLYNQLIKINSNVRDGSATVTSTSTGYGTSGITISSNFGTTSTRSFSSSYGNLTHEELLLIGRFVDSLGISENVTSNSTVALTTTVSPTISTALSATGSPISTVSPMVSTTANVSPTVSTDGTVSPIAATPIHSRTLAMDSKSTVDSPKCHALKKRSKESRISLSIPFNCENDESTIGNSFKAAKGATVTATATATATATTATVTTATTATTATTTTATTTAKKRKKRRINKRTATPCYKCYRSHLRVGRVIF
ncbi:hypothetical protein ACTA71_002472 [Dictyostelium dimigraforme]